MGLQIITPLKTRFASVLLIVSYAPNPNDSIENYIKDLQFLNRSHKEFVVVVLFGDASYIEHIPMHKILMLLFNALHIQRKPSSKTAHLLFERIGTNKDLTSEQTIHTEPNGRLSFSSLDEAQIPLESFKRK